MVHSVSGLSQDTVSGLGYIASIEGTVSEWWIGKDLKGSSRGLFYNRSDSLENCGAGLRRTTGNMNQST
jgi:hypothetical protein